MKNSAKATLLSFSKTAVFLHDIMVAANDVLEEGLCGCVGDLSANCRFELQEE